MNRDRNIVAEGMVVQCIDAKEQHNVDKPAFQWYFVRSKEKGWSCLVELRDIACDGDKYKLDKRQEGTAGGLDPREQETRQHPKQQ